MTQHPVLLIHPFIQACILFLAFWVTGQGLVRMYFGLLGKRKVFLWKHHVRLGMIVLCLWLTGSLVGAVVMSMVYGPPFVFGNHLKTALLMIPLVLFGILSGVVMDRKKKKRAVLPVLHGVNNLAVSAMAVVQARSGWDLLKALIMQ